jgi:hypothetical protein
VYMGIVPKMAVRFSSFESYKEMLAGPDGKVRAGGSALGCRCRAGVVAVGLRHPRPPWTVTPPGFASCHLHGGPGLRCD